MSSSNVPLIQKQPAKPALGSKFELPLRPEAIYREQSIEDFSDFFPEADNLFNKKTNRPRKVSICVSAAQQQGAARGESRPRRGGELRLNLSVLAIC